MWGVGKGQVRARGKSVEMFRTRWGKESKDVLGNVFTPNCNLLMRGSTPYDVETPAGGHLYMRGLP